MHTAGYFNRHPHYQGDNRWNGSDAETVLEFLGILPQHLLPDPDSTGTLVDVGCGYGRLIPVWSKCCTRTIGVDVRAEMLSTARRELISHMSGSFGAVELRAGDGHNLPLADREADWLVCLNVVQHLTTEQVKQLLREAGRVLRPGGKACFEFVDGPGLPRDVIKYGREQSAGRDPEEVVVWAEGTGLVKIAQHSAPAGGVPGVVIYWLIMQQLSGTCDKWCQEDPA